MSSAFLAWPKNSGETGLPSSDREFLLLLGFMKVIYRVLFTHSFIYQIWLRFIIYLFPSRILLIILQLRCYLAEYPISAGVNSSLPEKNMHLANAV